MLGTRASRDVSIRFVDQIPAYNRRTLPFAAEARFLHSCEEDVKRLATYWTKRLRLPEVDADDLQQDIQIQLLCLFRSELRPDEVAFKKLIPRLTFNKARAYSRARSRYEHLAIEPREERESLQSLDPIFSKAVARVVHDLPMNLWRVYDLIYRQGLSQSQAATLLSISQPRVSQLNQALLSLFASQLSIN